MDQSIQDQRAPELLDILSKRFDGRDFAGECILVYGFPCREGVISYFIADGLRREIPSLVVLDGGLSGHGDSRGVELDLSVILGSSFYEQVRSLVRYVDVSKLGIEDIVNHIESEGSALKEEYGRYRIGVYDLTLYKAGEDWESKKRFVEEYTASVKKPEVLGAFFMFYKRMYSLEDGMLVKRQFDKCIDLTIRDCRDYISFKNFEGLDDKGEKYRLGLLDWRDRDLLAHASRATSRANNAIL